jgi:flagellin
MSLLQYLCELAIQPVNAANNASDRIALQQEAVQLISEVDRIGETSLFNSKKIFL